MNKDETCKFKVDLQQYFRSESDRIWEDYICEKCLET